MKKSFFSGWRSLGILSARQAYYKFVSFYREIGNILGLDWIRISQGYSFVNYNGEAIYIEGLKRIVSFSKEEIILDTKKCRVRIVGEELFIALLEESTIIVQGKIISSAVE